MSLCCLCEYFLLSRTECYCGHSAYSKIEYEYDTEVVMETGRLTSYLVSILERMTKLINHA